MKRQVVVLFEFCVFPILLAFVCECLTADQLIDKAQTNASLLVEILSASSNEILSLRDFNSNDVLQTLYRECQGISDYLFERIWHDSGNDTNALYYSFDTSSHNDPQQKTVDEEAQIAAFIACSEQIQSAFRCYDEFKDHLQAKQLQEEESARARVYALHSTGDSVSFNNNNDDDGDNDVDDDDEYDNDRGQSIAGHDAAIQHLRKSEQHLVWKLDPREDFKANKTKMKRRMDQTERERLDQERMQERREGLKTPADALLEIPPEMLVLDNEEGKGESGSHSGVVRSAEERAQEELDLKKQKEDAIAKALQPDDGEDVLPLNAAPPVQEVDDEEEQEEDTGALSDDSWEEVPTLNIERLDIEDSVASSSSSSFLLTSLVNSPSATPTPL
ncbi:hypothetical protein BGZ94_007135 [Podila epigama]|nr:hypothetical protein BGZ94_007135 [Podila epigama]